MNVKRSKAKKQVKNETPINVPSREELRKRIEVVEAGLKARTWRNLETKGKFSNICLRSKLKLKKPVQELYRRCLMEI